VDMPFATYVINVDTLWNPAKMTQRCGRIDRLNQEAENIYVINLWMKQSIEEKMSEKLYEREELANQVIDGGVTEQRVRRLRFNDLKNMIRDLGGDI
jgi:SNF2 family DNA or RNA helicase